MRTLQRLSRCKLEISSDIRQFAFGLGSEIHWDDFFGGSYRSFLYSQGRTRETCSRLMTASLNLFRRLLKREVWGLNRPNQRRTNLAEMEMKLPPYSSMVQTMIPDPAQD